MTKYGMATKRQSSTSEVTSNPGAVITRSNKGSIDSFLPITGHKLNGHNYLQWSQSMMMFICGKSKDDHLTRAVTIPKKEDPTFKVWKSENNMVMSWLINSMTNEIGENFLPYDSSVTPVLQLPQASLATLDLFEVHEWKCPEDEALYKQIIKKKRVV
ncbi:hypothetical protein CK203_036736 [Vitis vinifera]|uniref:Retrotransposon Copia-like N-terminal domain-containing protein n=1 Tax=Vitis vinifera TaxID=29760 RepID=A0A438I0Q7_VITVI|nr:hypothetical protein CK203_036736 [Vitis vinifera]